MITASQSNAITVQSRSFPTVEVERRLRRELELVQAESRILRGDWEPVLDSLRMVSVVISLEDIFDFELPPEKLVRKGGYKSVDDGVTDMRVRLGRYWRERYESEDAS